MVLCLLNILWERGNRMDPRSKLKYGIGCLIGDCILILKDVIDLCTGKTTPKEMYLQIAFCAILIVPVVVLLRSYAKKRRR